MRIVKLRGAEREGIMFIQVGVHPGEQFNGINRFGRRRPANLGPLSHGRCHLFIVMETSLPNLLETPPLPSPAWEDQPDPVH